MKKIIILIISLIALISCKESSSDGFKAIEEPYYIKFDFSNHSPEKDFPLMSDEIDSLEYIKLEYVSEYPIGFIVSQQLPYITKDYLFFESSHEVGILQYKRNGEFVREIGSYGRGPGEYLQTRGFIIDENRGMTYVIPNWEKSIYKYDLNTGKYLGSVLLSDSEGTPLQENDVFSAYYLSKDEILINPSNERTLLFESDVFYTVDPVTGRQKSRTISNIFGTKNLGSGRRSLLLGSLFSDVWYDNNNRLNFLETCNDTVFVVHPNSITEPRIILDYGEFKKDLETVMNPNITLSISRSRVTFSRYNESKTYMFFYNSLNSIQYKSAFNKYTGEHLLVKSSTLEDYRKNVPFHGLYNDIDGGFSNMRQYNKDMWYATYDVLDFIDRLTPEHFDKVRNKVKYPDRLDKLQQFVSELDENDNPIFVIAHLKK